GAGVDEGAADQVGGEEAEHRDGEEGDHQAGARNAPWQVVLGPVGDRDERPHQVVDPGDERPGQVDRDRQRPGDHQAGQEIVAQPVGGAGVMNGRRIGPGEERLFLSVRRRLVGVHAGDFSRCRCGSASGAAARFPRTIWESARLSPVAPGSRGKPSVPGDYSTVTDFARFRGWSTSVPISTAVWVAISLTGTAETQGVTGAR